MFFLDSRAGDAVAIGDRVIINTQGELLDGTASFSVFDDLRHEHSVPKADLTVQPRSESIEGQLAAFNATVQAWGSETDIERGAVEVLSNAEHETLVRLTVTWTSGWIDVFEYAVEQDVARPLQWTSRGHP